MEKDLISRKYAINQIDMAISKEESKEERERLLLIKDFWRHYQALTYSKK